MINKNLFRGFGELLENDVIHKNIHFNGTRTPRDTDIRLHSICDNWFNEKFDIRARSSCIFVTQSREQAASYVSDIKFLKKVIPYPPYSCIFSTKVFDLYDLEFDVDFSKSEAELEEYVYTWLSSKDYQLVDNIEKIPDFSGEIMIFCESFYTRD